MRIRLILSFTLIVLVSVIAVVLFARLGAEQEVRTFMYRGGMLDTSELVNQLETYFQENGSWEGVQELLLPDRGQGLGPNGQGHGMMGGAGMGAQRLRLADAEGKIVFDSSDTTPSGQFTSEEQRASITIRSGIKPIGYLLPQGGMAFTALDQRLLLNRLTRAALIGGLVAGGMALLLALVLSHQLMRPVRGLTQASEQLAQGDLSQRVQIHGNDEIANLGRTFNAMANSLQAAEASRRAMTADIAHELRNPLAVQRANLEALVDGVYPLTPENLEQVLEQNHVLERLVEDLRTLALAETGQLALERVPFDLNQLVERVAERFRPQALPQHIQLITALTPIPEVLADPLRVEQILTNLLSNALRYTPPGGKVWLRSDLVHVLGEPQVRLQVQDNGTGIPTEAFPHIFERFYRADKARSRADGGSGLGLAIALQLAQAQGGLLTAENSPSGGALFTLFLPVRASNNGTQV